MSLSSRIQSLFLAVAGMGMVPLSFSAQVAYSPQAGEFRISGALLGDQVAPFLSAGASGGYLVWHDNATDGDGLGIAARRLNANFTPEFEPFRVNEIAAGDQEKARVAMLKNGGAVFVWQGGQVGRQAVFARFLAPNGTFVTGDVRVTSTAAPNEIEPAVVSLADGNVLMVWSAFGPDGDLQGVFSQRFSEDGQKLGGNLPVNQFTPFNQRSPAAVALASGDTVVAWVSEQQRFERSVDIYGRLLRPSGEFGGPEFLINSATNLCANPVLAATSNGGFAAAWSQRDIGEEVNLWDIYLRGFDAQAQPIRPATRVNEETDGHQFSPQVASLGGDLFAVWTSYGQDGTEEGVFGRFVSEGAEPIGPEFQVNTFAASRQFQPTVASSSERMAAVVWASFVGGATSFDLLAQRFGPAALTPPGPIVSALSPSALSISWRAVDSPEIVGIELHLDSRADPVLTSANPWTLGQLAPGSSHTFRMAYRFADGSRSALSEPATGKTWSSDDNFDGLPDDWQAMYWGNNPAAWANRDADSDGDGATNAEEFLAGTDPRNANSVLRTSITETEQGRFLAWNTQPGLVYQVQATGELREEWQDVGSPRFAVDSTDSVLLGGGDATVFYRVKRLR